MNLRHSILSVRQYGIVGIWNFIIRQRSERAFRLSLQRTNRTAAPEPGITIIGGFRQPTSLGKVLRDLAILLKKSEIPYQTYCTTTPNDIPVAETASILTPAEEFCANRYTHVLGIRQQWNVGDSRCSSYSIEFWEFEDGAVEGQPELLKFNKILAMSDFNRSAFQRAVPATTDVRSILYPFQFVHGPLASRSVTLRKFGLSENDFVVFFNFDYASSFNRKNPEAILHAFAKSIAQEPNTKILFKTMRAKSHEIQSTRLRQLATELEIDNRLFTIDDFIPQEDLVNLTNACDVYMSLHRGEGFGLGIAEAMSLGKPVIVTDYSATAEFCNIDNSIPIPYKLLGISPNQLDVDVYHHVTRWAEPDIDAAAVALRKLYDDPKLRRHIGENAKRSIEEHFSTARFKKSINSFIN